MAPVENKFDEVMDMMKDWSDEDVTVFMNNVFRAHSLSIVPQIVMQVQKVNTKVDDFEKHVKEATQPNS
jgi:CO dehydrogenase/acetyl-CoA synthase delta subunit